MPGPVPYDFYKAPDIDVNPAYALAQRGASQLAQEKSGFFDKLAESIYQNQQMSLRRDLAQRQQDFELQKANNLATLKTILQGNEDTAKMDRLNAVWGGKKEEGAANRQNRLDVKNLSIGGQQAVEQMKLDAGAQQAASTVRGLNALDGGQQIPFTSAMGIAGMNAVSRARAQNLLQQRAAFKQQQDAQDKQTTIDAISGAKNAKSGPFQDNPQEADVLLAMANSGQHKDAMNILDRRVKETAETRSAEVLRESWADAQTKLIKDRMKENPGDANAANDLQEIETIRASGLKGAALGQAMGHFTGRVHAEIGAKMLADQKAATEANKPKKITLADGSSFDDIAGISKGGKASEMSPQQEAQIRALAQKRVEKSADFKALWAKLQGKNSPEDNAAISGQMDRLKAQAAMDVSKELGWTDG